MKINKSQILGWQVCILILVLLAAILASTAVQAQSAQLSDERKQQLTHMVKQDCGSCHGMTLKGGLGSAILPADLANKSVDFITVAILHGRPGTAMPPWKSLLTNHEARWIAEQLKQGQFK